MTMGEILMNNQKLIYLASPYSHKSKGVMSIRHLLITLIGDKLIGQGTHVFGPITESHQYVAQGGNAGTAWTFWAEHDKLMITKCDELWVIKLKGWEASTGVTAEIEYAKELGIPIWYFDPLDLLPELQEAI